MSTALLPLPGPAVAGPPVLDPEFVAHVEQFAAELGVLASFLDIQTTGAAERDVHLAEALLDGFGRWMGARLETLDGLVRRIRPEAAPAHGAWFRARMRPFTDRSVFLKRTNDRPRGHAGDSEMMRMLYDRDFRGTSLFDRLLHRHPLESAAAEAVRARVSFVGDLVRERLGASTGLVRVCSVACGPARELRHALARADDAARTEFVLLDQDADALAEAEAELGLVRATLGAPIHARREQVSVRELLRSPVDRFGSFDLVYSMGLFDYLDASAARRLTERLVAMTGPNGRVVVGNFHVSTHTRTYLDYWMDWPLVYRTEAELLELVPNAGGLSAHVTFEATKSQMFLVIERTR